MRRRQCEITDRREIDKILTRCTIGRLATIGSDGYPYITPVNYTFHDGSIYFHCARAGEKLENINRESRVCFEVSIPLSYLDLAHEPQKPVCQVHQFYHCVIIRGRAELVEKSEEKVAALNSLMAVHEKNAAFDRITVQTPAVAACHVVAVRIESISGKSDLAQKKSDKEKILIANYLSQRKLPGDGEAAALISAQVIQSYEACPKKQD